MPARDVNELSNRYVADYWGHDPIAATMAGVPGYDDQLTDLSPEGFAARHELARRTLAELDGTPPSAGNEVAGPLLAERLGLEVEQHEAGEYLRDLNTLASPVQAVREVFDLMPTATDDEAATIARRMTAVPAALAGLQATYQAGISQQLVPARRQVEVVAAQCATWAGGSDGPGYFTELVDRLEDREGAKLPAALLKDLRTGAAAAESAYADMGEWFRTELAPVADPVDAVGPDRYRRAARMYTGAELDLDDTYEWGWVELERLDDEKQKTADTIAPDAGLAAAIQLLDADAARQVRGTDALQRWMQRLSDQAIDALAATHFDIADPIRILECRIAPPGGALGAYYTPPGDGFSRPGRMWWSVVGDTDEVFHTWLETTTVYHEGVPGHHLQCAQVVFRADVLNDYQRLLCWIPGHGEGWALYAEELMAELGYLDDPGDRLGMLDAQALRATRVVVDIGMHLGKPVKANRWGLPAGDTFTPELATQLMRAATSLPDDQIDSEVNRYLGWPGQAISYKVGQRYWLEARATARRRHGANFDLKAFHTAALDLGSVSLDVLQAELARL